MVLVYSITGVFKKKKNKKKKKKKMPVRNNMDDILRKETEEDKKNPIRPHYIHWLIPTLVGLVIVTIICILVVINLKE